MSGLLLNATFHFAAVVFALYRDNHIRYTDTPAIFRPSSYPYNYFFTVSKTEHCSLCLRHSIVWEFRAEQMRVFTGCAYKWCFGDRTNFSLVVDPAKDQWIADAHANNEIYKHAGVKENRRHTKKNIY